MVFNAPPFNQLPLQPDGQWTQAWWRYWQDCADAENAEGVGHAGAGFDQLPTGQFYENLGANIDRFNDRVLIGAATVQDANWPEVVTTWVALEGGGDYLYLDSLAQLQSVSTIGGLAGSFATRTSDITDGHAGAFGIVTLGINDATSGPLPGPVGTGNQAWGIYAPAVMVSPSGNYTCGVETDVCAAFGVTSATPSAFNTARPGTVVSFTAASGGELALTTDVSPASAAMVVFPATTFLLDPVGRAGSIFRKGIVINCEAILGTNGSVGGGIALEMATGHEIVWAFNEGGLDIGGMIRSDCHSGPYQTRVLFSTTQFKVAGVQADLTTEQVLFAVNPLPNQVVANAPSVTPGTPGSHAVQYTCQGSDNYIDLQLFPKTSFPFIGLVWLGNQPAFTAGTPANFHANFGIPIKDGAGNVYYIPLMASGW